MADTPAFAIYCKDKADGAPIRAGNIHLHREYLAGTHTRILLAGPLMNDDRSLAIGSFFVIEAQDSAAAQAFNRADPFCRIGLWASVEIIPFTVSRQTLGPA